MAPAIVIDVLPAGRGDSLWIECDTGGPRPWRMIVDGGMPDTFPVLRERVLAVPADDRVIDLAIVSHIDSDHIGGLLALLNAAGDLGMQFGDVWFNGLPQLPEPESAKSRSVSEGESLIKLLSGAGSVPLPWNLAFDRRAVMTSGDATIAPIELPGAPDITLLSPTPRRLIALRKTWEAELEGVRRGVAAEPAAPPEPPAPLDDLEALAATPTAMDGSRANGSSIAFLLEHQGASVLLTADAFVPVLGANERGGQPLHLDAFKLSHHGSKGNVTSELLALAPADRYLVCTNGDRFHHPDDVAIARVVTCAPDDAELWFNYRTDETARWEDARLRATHRYRTVYPDGATPGGVRLELAGTP
jgi:hypothetical protein